MGSDPFARLISSLLSFDVDELRGFLINVLYKIIAVHVPLKQFDFNYKHSVIIYMNKEK